MCPKVSKGEISVFSALSSAGLTAGMVTQQPIILKAAIPDFCWFELKKAVYLDGVQVHKKDRQQQQKDSEIVDLLEQRGWDVLCIPYEQPLTVLEVQEIIENIKQFIGLAVEEE
jgi:very-short-patch-repair endonuclease